MPEIESSTKSDEKGSRAQLKQLVDKWMVDYVKEIVKQLGDDLWKQEFLNVCNKVQMTVHPKDDKGIRAKVVLNDNTVVISVNAHFWNYSTDPDKMFTAVVNKFKCKNGSNWNWAEQKLISECEKKYFDVEKKALENLGFQLSIDLQSMQQSTQFDENDSKAASRKEANARKNLSYMWNKVLLDYSKEIQKFCSNADYKEALNDKCKIIQIGCHPVEKDVTARAKFEFKDKSLIILINPAMFNYSTDTNLLTKWLEKQL